MIQFARRNALSHFDQSTQRDHGVVATANVNVVNVFRRIAPCCLSLNNDVVLFGITLVTCHIAPAQHGFNGSGHHIHTDTQFCGLDSIDIDAQFGFVQTQINIGGNEARVFGNLVQHLTRDSIQVLIAVRRLNHKIDWALPEALPQRWRRNGERIDARDAAEFALHLTRNFRRGSLAFVPIDRAVNDAALGHGRIAQIGKDSVKFRVRAANPL